MVDEEDDDDDDDEFVDEVGVGIESERTVSVVVGEGITGWRKCGWGWGSDAVEWECPFGRCTIGEGVDVSGGLVVDVPDANALGEAVESEKRISCSA